MSLITHGSAGQLANSKTACAHIMNATQCTPAITGQTCDWYHANETLPWGQVPANFFHGKPGGCEPLCFGQDEELKLCTNATNATILCLLGGLINLFMGVFSFGAWAALARRGWLSRSTRMCLFAAGLRWLRWNMAPCRCNLPVFGGSAVWFMWCGVVWCTIDCVGVQVSSSISFRTQ